LFHQRDHDAMTTRHELSVVDFFLDRIAVASPQWENGLIVIKPKCLFVAVAKSLFPQLVLCKIQLFFKAKLQNPETSHGRHVDIVEYWERKTTSSCDLQLRADHINFRENR
jgi:hypothetical protein